MLKKGLISVLLFLTATLSWAQKRVSVDAEIKTLSDGKVTTATRRLLCDRSGALVAVSFTPVKSYLLTNLKGEAKFYAPKSNEVFSQADQAFSSSNELIYIFLSGRTDDLGLVSLGYVLNSSEYDQEGHLIRHFSTKKEGAAPYVDLVLKDYLPIYVEYKDHSGNPLGKTYLSGYDRNASFVFPTRVTSINYNREKRDSVVTRTVYGTPDISGKDPDFDFKIPAGAKPADNLLKRLQEAQGK